ncbi:MAG: hypothetical protein J4469_02020 [Candidatus Aenigmarchaeota archaeon]|nr:hypothetical protein [Candidatus Aenigmarchaeota archaeon]
MTNDIEIADFSNRIIQAYSATSILQRIADIVNYNPQYSNKEFIQIGERVLLPKEFFERNDIDNTVLAADFARSVVLGEKNFFLKHMIKISEDELIPRIKLDSFNFQLISGAILKNINDPTDIFIPLKESYYNAIYDLYGREVFNEGNAEFISIGNFRLRVHWVADESIKNIVAIDERGTRIIQKRFEDMIIPKGFNQPKYSFRPKSNIRIDFAESNQEDKFDVYMRTVISIENPKEKSSCVIEFTL